MGRHSRKLGENPRPEELRSLDRGENPAPLDDLGMASSTDVTGAIPALPSGEAQAEAYSEALGIHGRQLRDTRKRS